MTRDRTSSVPRSAKTRYRVFAGKRRGASGVILFYMFSSWKTWFCMCSLNPAFFGGVGFEAFLWKRLVASNSKKRIFASGKAVRRSQGDTVSPGLRRLAWPMWRCRENCFAAQCIILATGAIATTNAGNAKMNLWICSTVAIWVISAIAAVVALVNL